MALYRSAVPATCVRLSHSWCAFVQTSINRKYVSYNALRLSQSCRILPTTPSRAQRTVSMRLRCFFRCWTTRGARSRLDRSSCRSTFRRQLSGLSPWSERPMVRLDRCWISQVRFLSETCVWESRTGSMVLAVCWDYLQKANDVIVAGLWKTNDPLLLPVMNWAIVDYERPRSAKLAIVWPQVRRHWAGPPGLTQIT